MLASPGSLRIFSQPTASKRHMVKIYNIACDTLVQGCLFLHLGYVMRRPNARENYNFPRTVRPDDWVITHRVDVDPEAVSNRPPFCHRFVGVWPNIRCMPISNADGSNALFGKITTVNPPRRGRGQECLIVKICREARERERGEKEHRVHVLNEQD